jgi:hypothetical protein
MNQNINVCIWLPVIENNLLMLFFSSLMHLLKFLGRSCSELMIIANVFFSIHQKLTGGVMLSRNNEFIVFYRGKDFLSSELAEVLLERERLAKSLQDEEEARRKSASYFSSAETYAQPTVAGTLGETLEANSKYGTKRDENHADKMARTIEAARHADLVRKLEWKLSLVSGQDQV